MDGADEHVAALVEDLLCAVAVVRVDVEDGNRAFEPVCECGARHRRVVEVTGTAVARPAHMMARRAAARVRAGQQHPRAAADKPVVINGAENSLLLEAEAAKSEGNRPQGTDRPSRPRDASMGDSKALYPSIHGFGSGKGCLVGRGCLAGRAHLRRTGSRLRWLST